MLCNGNHGTEGKNKIDALLPLACEQQKKGGKSINVILTSLDNCIHIFEAVVVSTTHHQVTACPAALHAMAPSERRWIAGSGWLAHSLRPEQARGSECSFKWEVACEFDAVAWPIEVVAPLLRDCGKAGTSTSCASTSDRSADDCATKILAWSQKRQPSPTNPACIAAASTASL